MALRDFFGRLRGSSAQQPVPEQPQADPPAPLQDAPLLEPEAPPAEPLRLRQKRLPKPAGSRG